LKIKKLFEGTSEASMARLPVEIRERIEVDPASGCWQWTGKKAGSGQAMLYVGDGKSEIAYRVIYRMITGSLPKVLRHTCDNRACVNPSHLLPGSIRDNNNDASRRGKIKRKLSDREVQEIRWLLTKKRKIDIAALYGVTPELISHIQTKKRYHWLPWRPQQPA
jgi:hypothetical protein